MVFLHCLFLMLYFDWHRQVKVYTSNDEVIIQKIDNYQNSPYRLASVTDTATTYNTKKDIIRDLKPMINMFLFSCFLRSSVFSFTSLFQKYQNIKQQLDFVYLFCSIYLNQLSKQPKYRGPGSNQSCFQIFFLVFLKLFSGAVTLSKSTKEPGL